MRNSKKFLSKLACNEKSALVFTFFSLSKGILFFIAKAYNYSSLN